ncbi:MAG: DUF2066 domain-containing protein, partial [Bradyrhizobium sp.]
AAKRGLDIALPTASELATASSGRADQGAPTPARFGAVLPGVQVRLFGQLTWDDRELGWITQWQLDADGQRHHWQLRGVTFDDAFRRGFGGVAQILSGNGAP